MNKKPKAWDRQIVLGEECGVYLITNTVNGKVYVGSSCNTSRRRNKHKNDLQKGVHGNLRFQRAWNKYGASAFVFKVLLVCAKEYLLKWEQIAIDGHMNTLG